jgi:hypothetical protein
MTEEQQMWIERALSNQNIWGVRKARQYLKELVEKSEGRCRWTGLPLKFDRVSGTGRRDPLAAVIEHRQPGDNCEGHDIVCSYINQMKGCLPWKVWWALAGTTEFQEWMSGLRAEYEQTGTLAHPRIRATPQAHTDT